MHFFRLGILFFLIGVGSTMLSPGLVHADFGSPPAGEQQGQGNVKQAPQMMTPGDKEDAAKAAEQINTDGGKYGYVPPLSGVSIPALIGRVVRNLLPLIGALFFVMFVWGGILWLTADGEDGKIKKARETLTHAVIGMAIVVGAYVLVFNIISAFSGSLK